MPSRRKRACVLRARKSRFVDIFRTTPARNVCPNFYVLSHANGCGFSPACVYCYLQSSLWYLETARIFTNVEDLAGDVCAWIARDGLESTVLNTGNLSDSLGFERERPLAARLVELFREEAERKGRPHALLLVTKGGRDDIAPLAGLAPPVDERLAARVGGLAPERVTLGCLRADRGLMKKGNGVFAALGPLEETEEAWTAVGLDPGSKTCNCAT